MSGNNYTSKPTYDIVIAGGGLVGATMACLLDKLNLKIAMLDQASFNSDQIPFANNSPVFDPRVSALTAASIQLFSDLGVAGNPQAPRLSGA